jgi:hypothetical protein
MDCTDEESGTDFIVKAAHFLDDKFTVACFRWIADLSLVQMPFWDRLKGGFMNRIQPFRKAFSEFWQCVREDHAGVVATTDVTQTPVARPIACSCGHLHGCARRTEQTNPQLGGAPLKPEQTNPPLGSTRATAIKVEGVDETTTPAHADQSLQSIVCRAHGKRGCGEGQGGNESASKKSRVSQREEAVHKLQDQLVDTIPIIAQYMERLGGDAFRTVIGNMAEKLVKDVFDHMDLGE